MQRLSEVVAERRGQRQLQTRERVDHDARDVVFHDGAPDLFQRFIQGQVERPQVEEMERAFLEGRIMSGANGLLFK